MNETRPVIVIGGGLAGCEAAWQLSRCGLAVRLFEMKPARFSAAHRSPLLAELVCSNSLRSDRPDSAPGVLKREMRFLGSILLEAADAAAVPADRALAVDRLEFSRCIEERLSGTGRIEIRREEVTAIPPEGPVIIATGPLTSDALATEIAALTGKNHLFFYDAISPIVDGGTLRYERMFRASRYVEGEGDYWNCPLTEEQYEALRKAIVEGRTVEPRPFEETVYFEGCLPIEVLAARGVDTLRFGPMKPVGLTDPRTGSPPHAVVQLRAENRQETLFNLVGFQTKLAWPEQQRIFRTIPGLEEAEFARYGSIHRNTFLEAPSILAGDLSLLSRPDLFFAGQITGVEGYVESAATGLLAGISMACRARGRRFQPPPATTALGALLRHLGTRPAGRRSFQPMNIAFGLFDPLLRRLPRRLRGEAYAGRSRHDLSEWAERNGFTKGSEASHGAAVRP
ncbi:MAG TPA: methylenetetrahydrofolate--tRNA-(uracil(54)-C(5))-methyltransferase (FADH(2)-oxidizing) TrmFO [Syntrophales bacterium]|nr:methylenetetrahydrofolate--tRNA-(uracil(54)-C(5))-methyltransferase (FADH(2)-oxidizing) TrmFO [Syntrophales bacterium]